MNPKSIIKKYLKLLICSLLILSLFSCTNALAEKNNVRERISFNNDWKFFKYDSFESTDNLIYDIRPEFIRYKDSKPADSKPTLAENVSLSKEVLKPWILPSGNRFLKNIKDYHQRPDGNPGSNFSFVQYDFDDSSWETLNLPHDWAIKGPFYKGDNPEVGGGMGRLPSHGVAWYRKQFEMSSTDSTKSIYLDIDGAMSYAMVWLNGNLVGGWPYGYNSWRVDLTPFIKFGEGNQLAIRLDNPNNSSRWYPGGGIYRNVWLVKTNKIHVAQWGTFVKTHNVTSEFADIKLEIAIDNITNRTSELVVVTKVYELDKDSKKKNSSVLEFDKVKITLNAKQKIKVNHSSNLKDPKLWGPPPEQLPNMYVAVTKLYDGEKLLDIYETEFGVRSLEFDPNKGVLVNGELIKLKGVNQHHDLGALGAAFNYRAAERQLEILQEMGCNAIRMAHNPPAPELLELTDRMGFLVVDEVFDVWERKKTPHDFHLIFPDWYEQDLRSMIRRDKNHPSVIMWSFGNEVGEQYTDESGAALANKLQELCKDEDPTRLSTASKNWAKPDMPFPYSMDIISLNYQGQGIRQDPFFEGVDRIRTKPIFRDYHKLHPDKVILSSETASSFSSRGIYYFPIVKEASSYTRDGRGGNSKEQHVSSYGLYAVDFGSSPDKVFRSLDTNSFVAGEFVWTGWDHLGEPTPYYGARSSYCGIIDMAGFKKDKFYLYQSRWREDLPVAHILPHWNWPDRIGEITPVHVFTSGDEAELFLNGKSMGKKKKGEFEYRLRWDDIVYEIGELKVVAYKDGKQWAEDIVKTTDVPVKIELSADRSDISADGYDLTFITVSTRDKDGLEVPNVENLMEFEIEGNGEIIATDNGDETSFIPFSSHKRKLFSGKALVIVRSIKDKPGKITLRAKSEGLENNNIDISSK